MMGQRNSMRINVFGWKSLILALFFLAGSHAASAEQRIALVIGNSNYSGIGALPNPTADARLINQSLERLGFDSNVLLDANLATMKQGIARFGRALRSADTDAVGLFYFAGHGVQVQGRNYLLPIEAEPIDETDLDLMGVEANWVLRQMESAGNITNVIILDACRNNPFAASRRSVSSGLARIDAPTGSFISYATAPGRVALDGDDANSPYTAALAKAMDIEGLAIEQVFKQVRVDVLRETSGAQTPWDSSSLVNDFYFKPGNQTGSSLSQSSVTPVELSLWESVSASADSSRLKLFLEVFPESPFTAQARQLLSQLNEGASSQDPASAMNTDSISATDSLNSNMEAGIQPSVPTPSEHELIATAQRTRLAGDFQHYLELYPAGVFSDLAAAELNYLRGSDDTKQPVDVRIDTADKQSPVLLPAKLLFDTPLPEDSNDGSPRSLRILSQSQPGYPPVDGLSRDIWADKQCSSCHNWTQENLCKQGQYYVDGDESQVNRISHPFGGFFKNSVKQWAIDGCS